MFNLDIPNWLLIIAWVISSVVSAGFFFANFQDSYPVLAREERREDFIVSVGIGMMCGMFGPLGILSALVMNHCGRHGWRLSARKQSCSQGHLWTPAPHQKKVCITCKTVTRDYFAEIQQNLH